MIEVVIEVPPHLAEARRAAEVQCEVPPNVNIWRRNGDGHLYRSVGEPEMRQRVFVAMRAMNLSYPEIAMACGLPNHSTVITAVMKAQKGSVQ